MSDPDREPRRRAETASVTVTFDAELLDRLDERTGPGEDREAAVRRLLAEWLDERQE